MFTWGLGIGDWGLGIGPNPQSPNHKTQSPNHNQQSQLMIKNKKYKKIKDILIYHKFINF